MNLSDLKIVAEISANHLGSYDRAMTLVKEAAECGATHVKFQTFTVEDMIVKDQLIQTGPWKGRTLSSLYSEAQTPLEWHDDLFHYAKNIGITPFSSPFSPRAVKFLEELDCPIYKIASFELTDTPLIHAVAHTGKPIIMSTGMATEEEIRIACKEARRFGPRDITLLKCTSAYPSQPSDANLSTMSAMYFQFRVKVGVSDHSEGIGVACAAAGLGAVVVEKHLTLSRDDGGPDAAFSMEPDEFALMVKEVKRAFLSRGKIQYGPKTLEQTQFKRSLYFQKALQAGELITDSAIRTARPYAYVSPQQIDNFIGQVIVKDVESGSPVTWECINENDAR